MSIKTVMSNSPDFAEPQETAYQAAVRMRVLAAGKDPETTPVADVMTRSPVTIGESEEIPRALQLMQQHSVRRLPVEDQLGRICGIVSLDDILAGVAEQCRGVAQLLKSESPRGIAESPASRRE